MNLIGQNIERVGFLCKQYRVCKLFVFGSVLTDKFTIESDVDLVVDFDKIDDSEYADNYFNFKFSLQDLFKRNVDLLENQAIKNPYLRQSIDSSKQLIYGQ